jgi:hypothetical protein
MKKGSVLEAARGPFAVTAAHVVNECLKDSRSRMFVQCMIGSHGQAAYPFYLGDRIMDAHAEIDIATLRFTAGEIQTMAARSLQVRKEHGPALG